MINKSVIHIEQVGDAADAIMKVSGTDWDIAVMVSAAMIGAERFKNIIRLAVYLLEESEKRNENPEDLVMVKEMTEKEYNAS